MQMKKKMKIKEKIIMITIIIRRRERIITRIRIMTKTI